MLRCIPAIQPISNKDLRKTAFPVMERASTLFTELPFLCRHGLFSHPGTDVYATGDGTVVKMGWETGYGNLIIVDHGFGYQRGCAHLPGIPYQTGKQLVRCGLLVRVKYRQKSRTPPALRSACERAGRKSCELLLYGFKCRRLRPYDTDCGKSWKNDGLADYEMFN